MNRQSVAEDLLHEAVLRSWSGDRRWNPDNVDLWGFLVGVMKSLVYEAADSPENKTSSLDEPLGEKGGTKADRLKHDSDGMKEVQLREAQFTGMEEAMFTAAGDDPVLLKYVEAIMDGAGTSAEIAKRTGMAATAVYQAHRKLCRRVESRKTKEESP